MAAASAQILFIVNPGVKNAVIASTIAAVTNLPIICHTVFVPLLDPSFYLII